MRLKTILLLMIVLFIFVMVPVLLARQSRLTGYAVSDLISKEEAESLALDKFRQNIISDMEEKGAMDSSVKDILDHAEVQYSSLNNDVWEVYIKLPDREDLFKVMIKEEK